MLTELAGCNLKKVFNRRVIFKDVSFTLRPRHTLLITGPNGSGKSTLVKIVAGVLTPTEGEVKATWNESTVIQHLPPVIGLVSPYLQMYEEFSPRENLRFVLSVRGMKGFIEDIQPLLERMQLGARIDDPVRTFSSGMKQRVKYAFALIHRPPVLILDEPMANLDTDGVGLVNAIMDQHRREGILVVATNNPAELDRYDSRVQLGRR